MAFRLDGLLSSREYIACGRRTGYVLRTRDSEFHPSRVHDIGAEVATLLTGPAWSGHRVIELGSMVSADEVAEQLGEVLKRDVKAFAVPRAGWAEAFEQFGVPKGHTGPAEEMFESVNAGWMDLGITGTEHVAGTTSARDVFAAAQNAFSPGQAA